MLAHLARRAACALTRPRLAPAFARPPPPGRRTLAAAATGLDPPDVRKLAEMAHIDVTDEEVRRGERVEREFSPTDVLAFCLQHHTLSGRRLGTQNPVHRVLV